MTKNGGENDRLTDGRSGLMGIRLLTVSSLCLEVRREGVSVHESVTGNDTNRSAFGKDVQKRGLFSSAFSFV